MYDIELTSDGEHVRSLDRLGSDGRRLKGREKKINLMGAKAGTHGRKRDNLYRATSITHEGKPLRVKIATLVADTFLPPRPPGRVLRHGPNGKLDDSVGNLSYGTKSQDHQDMVRDGTAPRGEKHGRAKLTDVQWLEILDAKGTQQSIANRYGISRSYVSNIKSGKRRKYPRRQQ